MIFVGIDWAEAHHDVCVVDSDGRVLGRARIADGVAGVAALHRLIGEHTGDDDDPDRVVVGIETDRGLLVGALVGAGYQVMAVNPLAVSRYRDRHAVSGAKSDPGDARVLADLVRTDRHVHRPIAGDSDLADAVKLLARAHQSAIWFRQRQVNQLRSALREYYPAALAAFGADLDHPDAVAVLALAPTPELGRRLSTAKIRSALARAGRQRNLDTRAAAIRDALRADQLQPSALVADAYATITAAAVRLIRVETEQIAALETALADHFEQHPDAAILRSLPGLGTVLGARVLGEFGDDPDRYADAKSRRNYAGTSPITRASGTRRVVLARFIRNRRLADAIEWWAFNAISRSPGARARYDRHRANGETHRQALRAVGNKLVGILHGCLRHHQPYQEHLAWPSPIPLAA